MTNKSEQIEQIRQDLSVVKILARTLMTNEVFNHSLDAQAGAICERLDIIDREIEYFLNSLLFTSSPPNASEAPNASEESKPSPTEQLQLAEQTTTTSVASSPPSPSLSSPDLLGREESGEVKASKMISEIDKELDYNAALLARFKDK